LHPRRPTGQEIAAAPINQYSLTHLQAVPIATMQRSSLIAEVAVSSGGSPVTVKFAVGEVWAKQAGEWKCRYHQATVLK
jgi:hypothetical protein